MGNARKRGLWGTMFGFYLAAIGSAFGLGNLWRFPYVTAENGGGAFVFIYVVCAICVGLPLLIGELLLGKISRRGVVAASAVNHKVGAPISHSDKRSWVGRGAIFICLLLLAYYAVISGWVLHFLMQFFFGHLVAGHYDAETSLRVLRDGGWLQILLASVHLLITLIIVGKGVQQGMEKWVARSMPVFLLLLVVLMTKSLSLPSAPNALRFLFYPDFSKLTYFSMLQALGHVFFSLSIGFGTMVTFGSYLEERAHVPSAGFRVTALDTIISICAGLLIFPLLAGALMMDVGPELLFRTLPILLQDLNNGFLFGLAFFTCLYLAALGASIGLLESVVANILDATKLTRTQATWLTGAVGFLLAVIPALSTSFFKNIGWQGHTLLDLFDRLLVDVLLPLSALGVSIVLIKKYDTARLKSEFINDESIASQKMFSYWRFAVRWIVPAVILVAFVLAAIGLWPRKMT